MLFTGILPLFGLVKNTGQMCATAHCSEKKQALLGKYEVKIKLLTFNKNSGERIVVWLIQSMLLIV